MCIRGPASHTPHRWIDWAQTHGSRETLNRKLRFAEPVFGPAAVRPCLGQIGIEHKRSINQGGAYPEIESNIHQCIPTGGESDRVILAQLDRSLSKPCHLGNLVRCDWKIAISLGVPVAMGRTTVGARKVRVEFDRAIKQMQCLVVRLSGKLIKLGQTT